jgi:alpha-L-fucosidase 2
MKLTKRTSLASIGLFILAGLATAVTLPMRAAGADPVPSQLVLWYAQPAQRWLEALPVGNGRLGAMIFGGVDQERLALNESTVWSGAPNHRHDNPAGQEHLAEIRQLFFEGKYIEARVLCAKYLIVDQEYNYGTHLPMANLLLDFKTNGAAVKDYRRELDLRDGVARVEYSIDGAHYTREILASHPDGVLVVRLTCDQPGKLNFAVKLNGGDLPSEVSAPDDHTLVITGQAYEQKHSDGHTGVQFVSSVRVLNQGGQVSAVADQLQVERADAVTLIIAANTSFRGQHPAAACQQQTDAAARRTFDRLRQRHVTDYQKLFGRVELSLGGESQTNRPTDERLAAVRAGGDDPQLCALFFQYGRYLLIAGSREDSPLPTNLQGIWNDNLACNMGWTCDFHLDINTQQNYWPAEVCNLAECHEPLFNFIESLREPGRRTAKTVYGATNGWVCHVFSNPWGFTSPGWGLTWGIHPTGGIWIASDLWQHYLFTRDQSFLASRAYPVLKEAAEFFLNYLIVEPKHGWLVTGPSDSPENTFITPDGQWCSESMGPTCDNVLVRDLFSSCIEASQTLGVDADFRAQLEAARAKLPPLRIGKHGQLMEWLEDFDEAYPNHRHTSHLIALFPSHQITPRGTPELAEAARVTLDRRLGRKNWEDVEWSRGNAINFYARLDDGEKAHTHLLGLLSQDTDQDLLTFSRGGVAGAPQNIFCIDGNFAGTAAVAEMLVQSQNGEIELLPALPSAWPNGSLKGLRARGGFVVDITWQNGKLLSATVHNISGSTGQIRYAGEVKEFKLKPGATLHLNGDLE